MIVGKEDKGIDLNPLKDLVYFSLLEICVFFTCPFGSKDSRVFVARQVVPEVVPL